MIKKVHRDNYRFREIIKGRVRKNLRDYITRGELIGKQGKNIVSIPVPYIHIPKFRYEWRKIGGIGQGKGEQGTPIGTAEGEGGISGAGDQPGTHIIEVEITLDELAKILGEELELPRIRPKGRLSMMSEKDVYTGISLVGPESLRHFKRTYREALKRQLIEGAYDWDNPNIVPIPRDKRYRSWKRKEYPQTNAVIIYMMDVSGSMGDEQKEIVRIEAFWIDTWLRSQYRKLETRYIVHDAVAREVDQHTFYHIKESGGTKISSAYELCKKMIEKDYDPNDWNIYPMHFSDGDNWGSDDTRRCIEILEGSLLPWSNLFCYGQVRSPYGSGQFKRDLDRYFGKHEKLVTSEITDKDAIYDSIKEFLGKGK